MAADRVARRTTAGAVAGAAAMTSYGHAHALARAHGEADRTAVLPLGQAREALSGVADQHTRGKIVLQIGQ